MDADACANVANALEELKIGTEEAMKHQARTSLGKKKMKIEIKSNFRTNRVSFIVIVTQQSFLLRWG